MRNRIFTILALICICISANAQYSYRYSTMTINGSPFSVKYNEQDLTCEIVDDGYKVDDRKYALSAKNRKLKGVLKVNNLRIIEIPSEVEINGKKYTLTTIGRTAFAGYNNIDEIILPATVTKIAEYAFYRSSIKQIVLPTTVQSIGDRAFGHCEKLVHISMPRDIEIGKDIYAESKCNVDYTTGTVREYTSVRQEKRQIDQPEVSGTGGSASADVDQNVPTNAATNDNTFAIIIANEKYLTESNVKYAMNDGQSFRDYCSKVLGIPNSNIRYRENATLNIMSEDFDWMTKVANAFDGQARFIFYYAGHGIPDESNGSAYLLPVDGNGSNVKTGYSLNTLYQQFGKLDAENVTVFLDACFSGSQRGDGMLASARGVAIKAKVNAPTGKLVVFSAAQGDETAYPYDDMGHGMFTYFLLKKLKETNGKASLSELGAYVTREVKRRSIVSNGKQQTPTVSASSSLGDNWKNLKLR